MHLSASCLGNLCNRTGAKVACLSMDLSQLAASSFAAPVRSASGACDTCPHARIERVVEARDIVHIPASHHGDL